MGLSPQLWSKVKQQPELLSTSERQLVEVLLQENLDTSRLLQQLDAIDNAACGWSSFMAKVGLTQDLTTQSALTQTLTQILILTLTHTQNCT